MERQNKILVVDDEKNIRSLFQKELGGDSRLIEVAPDAANARKMIKQGHYVVLVLDICLPDGDGINLLEEFKSGLPDTEIILITGYGTIDSAVEAMRIGAYDYITKPFKLDRVDCILEKAVQRSSLQRENRVLKAAQREQSSPELVGSSEGIKEVMKLIRKVAPTNAPVLLTGESGVGKDVAARSIHNRSKRSNQPLIVKNCGTLQKDLMRSELFGHIKGAFTGAMQDQEGLMEMAHQGTMFLDEIGELPLEMQGALLRVLESQKFRKLGAKEEKQADIRFLFATNKNLKDEVNEGRFHEALYHRINVLEINIPELRRRKEDIPVLTEYFLSTLSPDRRVEVSDKAMQALMQYDWPGNVRELKNVLERGIILAEGNLLTEKELPFSLKIDESKKSNFESGFLPLKELEKEYVQKVLDFCSGQRTKAAKILGISRKTLYRKLNE